MTIISDITIPRRRKFHLMKKILDLIHKRKTHEKRTTIISHQFILQSRTEIGKNKSESEWGSLSYFLHKIHQRPQQGMLQKTDSASDSLSKLQNLLMLVVNSSTLTSPETCKTPFRMALILHKIYAEKAKSHRKQNLKQSSPHYQDSASELILNNTQIELLRFKQNQYGNFTFWRKPRNKKGVFLVLKTPIERCLWGFRKQYFNEDQHGSKWGSNVEQEASVGGKPIDVTLIARVDKYGSSMGPVLGVDEVLLVEDCGALRREGEVVQELREVLGLEWELGFWFLCVAYLFQCRPMNCSWKHRWKWFRSFCSCSYGEKKQKQ